jgi:DNA ligase-1
LRLPTLYKRSVAGKITTWYVETEENKFRTVSGFTDGIKTTSEWTVCEGKSYNTSNQQAEKQAKALHKKKIELGAFEDINQIDTPVFFKPMLAKELNDVEVVFPMASQPKYDGVRCPVRGDGMWSRNGKKIVSAPHIYESLIPIFEKYPELVLDGELFAERSEEVDFNKIISCVRKTKPEPEDLVESARHIKLFVYDCPSHDGGFLERYRFLKEIEPEFPDTIKLVPTSVINDMEQVKFMFSQYIEWGYEGEMLRTLDGPYENKRSKHLLKYKEFKTEEYIIQGVEEGKGKLTGKVGRLVFEQFNSAVNGDHEYLQMLFEAGDLIGKPATVRFQELTPDGIPRFPKVIAIRDYEG